SAEPSTPVTVASGQRSLISSVTLPAPAPRSAIARGAKSGIRINRSTAGRSRWPENFRYCCGSQTIAQRLFFFVFPSSRLLVTTARPAQAIREAGGTGRKRTTRSKKQTRERVTMDLGLKSKPAVVTGASIGIGRAIAKGLAAEGVRVVGVARRTDLLAELVQEVGGGLITPFEQDVMAKDAAEKIAAFALKELGHVDILINNAGGSRPLPVDAPDSKWDEAIALNFTSYRRIAHALLPQLLTPTWCSMCNVSGTSTPRV